MLSYTEENYLKTLLKILIDTGEPQAGSHQLASALAVKPATVTDMLKKLKDKALIDYERYGKISLTEEGRVLALQVLRKHRLWETFLFQKLEFSWDEVHEVAEQLEHIQSPKLVDKLDKFLDFPKVDPHGDPIPDKKGRLATHSKHSLAQVLVGRSARMVGVKEFSTAFLQQVQQMGLTLQSMVKVMGLQPFDRSQTIRLGKKELSLSQQMAENILVACPHCAGEGKECAFV